MPDVWYQLLSKLCARVYFSRVDVLPAAPRLSGPTLLVALHRNGAVDGWIYKSIFPSATFLIAGQLRRNLFARLFFTGITVVRDKDDGDRSANPEAMNRCYELLAAGGVLAIFPEGTSSLGPRHLPFKSGAARIAADSWQRNVPLTVIPLGITYDAPSTFRSCVQVIIGSSLTLSSLSASLSVAEIKTELSNCLEAVGVNVDSDTHYDEIRTLASFVSPNFPYHYALKTLERAMASTLQDPWRALRDSLASHGLLHPEKSPFSPRSPLLTLLSALFLSPFVLAAGLLNAPPLLGAYLAGRRFPDGPNVITLWRILFGAPLFVFWLLTLLATAVALTAPLLFLPYLAFSLLGLFVYARWKCLLRHSVNALRAPSLRSNYLVFRSNLLHELRGHAD
jgi:Acyltransferase